MSGPKQLDPIVAELRAARRRRGLSLQVVADLMGCGWHQSVCRWERGANPSLRSTHEWARALGKRLVLVPDEREVARDDAGA